MQDGPKPSLVFHPACRFSADKWSLIPEVPTFPAFFLGALSVDLSPSDTFMKLEVWNPSLPVTPSTTCIWGFSVFTLPSPKGPLGPPWGRRWAQSRNLVVFLKVQSELNGLLGGSELVGMGGNIHP